MLVPARAAHGGPARHFHCTPVLTAVLVYCLVAGWLYYIKNIRHTHGGAAGDSLGHNVTTIRNIDIFTLVLVLPD